MKHVRKKKPLLLLHHLLSHVEQDFFFMMIVKFKGKIKFVEANQMKSVGNMINMKIKVKIKMMTKKRAVENLVKIRKRKKVKKPLKIFRKLKNIQILEVSEAVDVGVVTEVVRQEEEEKKLPRPIMVTQTKKLLINLSQGQIIVAKTMVVIARVNRMNRIDLQDIKVSTKQNKTMKKKILKSRLVIPLVQLSLDHQVGVEEGVVQQFVVEN